MLCQKNRMSPHWSLFSIIGNHRRRQTLTYKILCMPPNCVHPFVTNILPVFLRQTEPTPKPGCRNPLKQIPLPPFDPGIVGSNAFRSTISSDIRQINPCPLSFRLIPASNAAAETAGTHFPAAVRECHTFTGDTFSLSEKTHALNTEYHKKIRLTCAIIQYYD